MVNKAVDRLAVTAALSDPACARILVIRRSTNASSVRQLFLGIHAHVLCNEEHMLWPSISRPVLTQFSPSQKTLGRQLKSGFAGVGKSGGMLSVRTSYATFAKASRY
ncbi:hypothetical protein E2C01_018297 [Portunus trituberculatus]|uniref:Uncharacterized protein n=1 Tax=Portunus trituberculatus TaxID=210409 RepID=A0A5B7DWG0_PORTR|nr:hypothetical protein [Portunus trituberculatus]